MHPKKLFTQLGVYFSLNTDTFLATRLTHTENTKVSVENKTDTEIVP